MRYKNQVFIIAEAGVNHNGDFKLMRKLVDIAAESGADAVKFQTFKAANLASISAKKADYQLKTTSEDESHFQMLKKLELEESDHYKLKDYCEKKGIIFLSTAFDLQSLKFLTNKLKLKTLKIT